MNSNITMLSTFDGLSFKYDRRGNVIEKSQNGDILNTYIYGADSRLKQAKNSKGETALYKYNGLGRRVSRIVGSVEVDYLLDQTKMYNNLLEAEGEEYIWDENYLLFRNAEEQIRDRLGSPIEMPEFGADIAPNTLGFTGYMYDDISGTYFAQAREYLPEVGRFAGRDIVKGTIQEPLTLNNYHYCYSNPMKYVDWDGNTPIDAAIAVYAMTGGDLKEMANVAAFYGYVKVSGDTSCTYSSTVKGGGGAVVGGGIAYGYAIDGKGNIAKVYSYEATTNPIPGAAAGKNVSVSNADDLDTWFRDKSYGVDAGGGEGVSVSAGFRRGYNDRTGKFTYKEYDFFAGVGVSLAPATVQGAWTSTDDFFDIRYNLNDLWNAEKTPKPKKSLD